MHAYFNKCLLTWLDDKSSKKPRIYQAMFEVFVTRFSEVQNVKVLESDNLNKSVIPCSENHFYTIKFPEFVESVENESMSFKQTIVYELRQAL